jgi:hypothetical protein
MGGVRICTQYCKIAAGRHYDAFAKSGLGYLFYRGGVSLPFSSKLKRFTGAACRFFRRACADFL